MIDDDDDDSNEILFLFLQVYGLLSIWRGQE